MITSLCKIAPNIMKRKPNPIRCTVENWISRHPKDKKPKVTLKTFFEDLENRGPVTFKSESIFEKWTKKIRTDMQLAGTWVKDSKSFDVIKFVQEYISRLQAEFWNENQSLLPDILKYSNFYYSDKYYHLHLNKVKTFKRVYFKIRVFGLRSKLYYLQKFLRPSILARSFIYPYEIGCNVRKLKYKLWHCGEDKRSFSSTPFGFYEVFEYASKNVANVNHIFQ